MNFSNSLHRRDDFSIVSSSAKQSWSFLGVPLKQRAREKKKEKEKEEDEEEEEEEKKEEEEEEKEEERLGLSVFGL